MKDSALVPVLTFIGWSIIVIGIIAGVIEFELSFISGIVIILGSILSGVFFMALSKIIECLENIETKLSINKERVFKRNIKPHSKF